MDSSKLRKDIWKRGKWWWLSTLREER